MLQINYYLFCDKCGGYFTNPQIGIIKIFYRTRVDVTCGYNVWS